MKFLSKAEQKEIYINLLKEQKQQAQKIIEESVVELKPKQKQEAEILILRAINISNNYNVSFDTIAEEIKTQLKSHEAISSLKQYCHKLFTRAHKFKHTLDHTMQEGLRRRQEQQTKYPAIFDKNATLFISIENSLSAVDVVNQKLFEINETLPHDEKLNYNKEQNKITDQKQNFAVGAFFSRRANLLKEVLSQNIDFSDKELENILSERNYASLIKLRMHRSKNKDKTNHDLIKMLGDKVIFYQIGDLLKKQHSQNFAEKLRHSLLSLHESFHRASQMIDFSQKQKALSSDSLSIDTLIFSIHPHLLATQSEYKSWRNCTSADDFNHHKVIDGIAEGSIIVYGINSKLPQKKISRILLTPYTNEEGDIIYHANRNYGEYNLSFRKAVETLARKISSKQKGIYKINPHILPDHAPENLLQFPTAEEFCQYQKMAYDRSKDGKIELENLNLSRYGLHQLPEFFQDIRAKQVDLSFNPLENLENCPECQTLNISHCDNFDKDVGKQIPLSITQLNARFSNFNGTGISKDSKLEELNISNNDALAKDFLQNLPPKLKILQANYTNLTSLKGLPAHIEKLSIDGCNLETTPTPTLLRCQQNHTH